MTGPRPDFLETLRQMAQKPDATRTPDLKASFDDLMRQLTGGGTVSNRYEGLRPAIPVLQGMMPDYISGPVGAEGAAAKLAASGKGSLPHVPEVRAVLEELRLHPERPRATEIPLERGQAFAKAYDQLPAVDPNAGPAYDLLNEHILNQRKRLEQAGYRFEFVPENPYRTSADMVRDVAENRRLKVLQTPKDDFHPYLTPEQNDNFRGVHDMLAHAGGGNQFGPIGEENAYRAHVSTLPKLAQQALATETRGQNSWVNFGPNAHLPAAQRPYATQKAALWPKALLLGGLFSAFNGNGKQEPYEP